MPWTKIPSISPRRNLRPSWGTARNRDCISNWSGGRPKRIKCQRKIAEANVEHFKKLLETKTDAKSAL